MYGATFIAGKMLGTTNRLLFAAGNLEKLSGRTGMGNGMMESINLLSP